MDERLASAAAAAGLGNAVAPGVGGLVGAALGVALSERDAIAETVRDALATEAERCARAYGEAWTTDPTSGACVIRAEHARALVAAARNGDARAKAVIGSVRDHARTGAPEGIAAAEVLARAARDQRIATYVTRYTRAPGRPVPFGSVGALADARCCASCPGGKP